MTKKLETKKLIASLNQTSRKTKKAFWKNIANIIEKPTRNRVIINIDKLDMLAEKFKGKIIVVPGKILSKGELNNKAKIVSVQASSKAIEKINSKGEYLFLKDFIDDKVKVKDLVIVK